MHIDVESKSVIFFMFIVARDYPNIF